MVLVGDRRRGVIRYDEARGCFVIGVQDWRRVDRRGQSRMQRFVYAHEFVHRFLFVETAGNWERALSQVVNGAAREYQLNVLRFLSDIEERICNEVAGQLLVPGDDLQSIVNATLAAETLGNHTLVMLFEEVARTFAVSWWCAARRIAATCQSTVTASLGDPYVLLWLGHGTGRRRGFGTPALRVMDAWWPRRVRDHVVRPIYPGLRVARLGPDIERIAREYEARYRTSNSLGRGSHAAESVSCTIELLSTKGLPIRARLTGLSHVWTSVGGARMLVHGRVDPY